ncbi:hypothetical protein [Rhizobium sp. L245/93]|uniref:hypothetical protein n=1 Tax=Rhizobium sp. L245/93 TaxID=2819998 RepID=UPI001ADD5AA3|nr:hypothetical protein [Rhizobium sp. L245/93]MBO9170881.1 hypothetical protein [Rhizobium sp. L245/93]
MSKSPIKWRRSGMRAMLGNVKVGYLATGIRCDPDGSEIFYSWCYHFKLAEHDPNGDYFQRATPDTKKAAQAALQKEIEDWLEKADLWHPKKVSETTEEARADREAAVQICS